MDLDIAIAIGFPMTQALAVALNAVRGGAGRLTRCEGNRSVVASTKRRPGGDRVFEGMKLGEVGSPDIGVTGRR